MAFRSQTAYQDIKLITSQTKRSKIQTRTPSQSSSPQQTQTEKRHYNCNAASNQNMYQKSTERNTCKIIAVDSICLTERSSPTNREDNWHIDFKEKEDTSKQGLTQIYRTLQDQGLLEAFQSFQTLRNFIIEDLSLQNTSKAQQINGKLNLFQFIAHFKAKILHLHSTQQSSQNNDHLQSLKELLKQVSFLRAENCRLKNKINGSQNGHSPNPCIHNSIFQNSITFRDHQSATSINTNGCNSPISLEIKKPRNQCIQPFRLVEQDKEELISCNLQEKLSVLKRESSLIAAWQKCLNNTISVCKQVFKNYLFCSNVALCQSSRLNQLANIVKVYNNYKSIALQPSEHQFLRQSYRLTQLISSLSQSIARLVKSQFIGISKTT